MSTATNAVRDNLKMVKGVLDDTLTIVEGIATSSVVTPTQPTPTVLVPEVGPTGPVGGPGALGVDPSVVPFLHVPAVESNVVPILPPAVEVPITAPLPVVETTGGQRKAVIVGINTYPNAPLQGCVNDARQNADECVKNYGFKETNVRLLFDERATTANILDRLAWLVQDAKAGDILFFAYSGHGAQTATRDGMGRTNGLAEVICFTGDTKVPLLDGTEKTLKELAEAKTPFWVYSIDGRGNIKPGLATHPRLTKRNAPIVSVRLDNGECVRCTPEHLWMLRDGTYRQAKKLKPGDSLMPLYRSHYNVGKRGHKYGLVMNTSTHEYETTHRVIAGPCPVDVEDRAEQQQCGVVVHHKNFNHIDNRPENLQWMTWKEHTAIHTQSLEARAERSRFSKEVWKRPGHKERMSLVQKGAAAIRWLDPEYRRKISEASSQQDLTAMHLGSAQYVASLTEAQKAARASHAGVCNKGVKKPKRYVEMMQKRWQDPEYREKMCAAQKAFALRRWQNPEYRKQMSAMSCRGGGALVNHKVVSVSDAGVADVYDITVPEYGNFALSAGVFVHNCPYDFDWSPEHMIIDAQFVELFGKLPLGVRLYWISDSCHSGGLNVKVFGNNPRRMVPKEFPMPADVRWQVDAAKRAGFSSKRNLRAFLDGRLEVAFVPGCKSNQTSADTSVNGVPCGACTWYFWEAVKKLNRTGTVKADADYARTSLANDGYEQAPIADGPSIGNVWLK